MDDARTQLQQLKEQMDRGTPVSREQLDRIGDALDAPKPAAPERVGDPPSTEGTDEEPDDPVTGKKSTRRR